MENKTTRVSAFTKLTFNKGKIIENTQRKKSTEWNQWVKSGVKKRNGAVEGRETNGEVGKEYQRSRSEKKNIFIEKLFDLKTKE